MTVEDSSISDNRATSGGGLRNQATASTTIRRTTLDRNVATSSSGGGIFSQIDAALTVEASTVSRNGASSNGGGLFLQNDGSTAILNSTVSGNLSFGNGGGIFLQNDQTMTMASSTVTNNRSIGEGGGIRSSLDPGASLTVGSTIFAGNEAADPGPDCFVPTGEETIASAGNNLVGDGTGCDLAAAVGDQVGSGSAPIDPGLGPLAANGGPTETHLPSLTSPAIDAGDVGALPGDQRGLPRTIDQPGVPNAPGSDGSDVGATELALVPAPRCKGAVATIFTIASGPATLNGSPRRDVIVGTTAGDKINAKGGNDLVCAKGGADTVRGGAGNDRLFGEGGRDRLLGGGGRDLLSGGGGRDRCVGGPGRDTLRSC
jgi:Ca2+-binding RTX toxin-like protein